MKIVILFCFVVFWSLSPVPEVHGEDSYNAPNNYGVTGLWDMPTARLMPDWNFRIHYSYVKPYGTSGLTATFLPWLEVNGRITRFLDVPSRWANYGDSRDKELDLKLRLLNESDSLPAVALGLNDIHGTAIFSSRYFVLSKLVGPFDVSLGLGQGVMAGDITTGKGSAGEASEDAGFTFLTSNPTRRTKPFGGVELRLTERMSLLGEYSSLDYENLYGFNRTTKSNFNFGLKYRLWKSILSASYQRGDTFGLSLAGQFPLKPEGMLPWKKRPFWFPGDELKNRAWSASNEELALILRHDVSAEGFSNVRTSVSDISVWVEVENPTYLSNVKAMGRALRTVSVLVPPRIEWIYLSMKSKDLIVMTIKICRDDFEAFLDNRIDAAGLLEFAEFDNEGNELRGIFLRDESGASPLNKSYGAKKLTYGLKPSWKTFFNDPSGFLKHSFSVLGQASYYPWQGALLNGSIRLPLYNAISSSNEIEEPDPVRTDNVLYLGNQNMRLETFAFDQSVNLPFKMLGRAEIGFFESAYGGFGLEAFRFFKEGRWGLGLETEWVKKRDLENEFDFKENSPTYKTGYLNIYHKLIPELGLDAGLKLGRFIAGDTGWRLDISRTFRHFTIGAWYTVTNSADVFTADYNRGYHDKGIYMVVPFSVFTDKESPRKLFYGFTPWGRDPGQTVNQINTLYPMAGKGNIDDFKRNIGELRE